MEEVKNKRLWPTEKKDPKFKYYIQEQLDIQIEWTSTYQLHTHIIESTHPTLMIESAIDKKVYPTMLIIQIHF